MPNSGCSSSSLLVLGVYLAFLYRDRVMVLLTGDDRFHVDLNSMIWKVTDSGVEAVNASGQQC